MKNALFVFVLVSFLACDSGKDAKVQSMTTKDSVTAENIVYPNGIVPRKFQVSDPRITANMLEIYKGWADNNFVLVKEHMADSMTVYGADGSVFGGTRDSVIAQMQAYRNMYKSMEPRYISFFPVKDLDQGESWFLMWYTENQTDLNGKTNLTELMETWKLDRDGKPFILYQYTMNRPPAANKK